MKGSTWGRHIFDISSANLYTPLTIEDETFLMAIVKRDMQRYRYALRCKAAQFFPKLAIQQLALFIDYCSVPPKYDVFDLRDFDRVYAGSAVRQRIFVANHTPESSKRMIENQSMIGRAPVIAVVPRGIYIENQILYVSVAWWEVEREYMNSLVRTYEERTGRFEEDLDGEKSMLKRLLVYPFRLLKKRTTRKACAACLMVSWWRSSALGMTLKGLGWLDGARKRLILMQPSV